MGERRGAPDRATLGHGVDGHGDERSEPLGSIVLEALPGGRLVVFTDKTESAHAYVVDASGEITADGAQPALGYFDAATETSYAFAHYRDGAGVDAVRLDGRARFIHEASEYAGTYLTVGATGLFAWGDYSDRSFGVTKYRK